ncbi:MAG: hypothetical protein HYZ72_08890, partial [Deltaproteobacteria bacterium]|nr:hypothetical protein [Deltaproteobacteria bacterium]
MKQGIAVVITIVVAFFGTGGRVWGEEVPFTLEDRDRLIRLEATLREFKESVDKRLEQVDKRLEEFQRGVDRRFEQVDKRFEQVDKRFKEIIAFMWMLAGVFGGLVAVTIGFAVWDRRTALVPALRRSRELEEREERIERA